MGHSFTKIWIHVICVTKHREHLIHEHFEKDLYDFIRLEADKMNSTIIEINGTENHIHCLLRIHASCSVSEIMKQIKGSSSFYINSNGLTKEKFAWQNGYAAFSVSESGIPNVRKYIRNQKKHHQKQTFDQELKEFVKIEQGEPNEPRV